MKVVLGALGALEVDSLINCLRFATPAEANRRPEARRDTIRTSQGRTSDAQGCIDERQLAKIEKQGWKACSSKAWEHLEGVFCAPGTTFGSPGSS